MAVPTERQSIFLGRSKSLSAYLRGGNLEPKIVVYVEDNGAWLRMGKPTERSGI